MINPYFCYVFSFATAILVYLLGWSDLYPPLSFTLLCFLVITTAVHLYAGIRLRRSGTIVFEPVMLSSHTAPLFITVALYVLWSVDCVHAGGIPLLKILLGQPYNYRIFGIPSVHVFIVTFSSFYTIYLFHLYLSSRRKMILVLYLINLFAAILIYNRGMFLFNLSSSFFLFLITLKRIPQQLRYALPLALVVLFYLFGVLGTLRVSHEARREYTNTLFMHTGQANHRFIRSAVPKEYFWTYIYISSPLANLQRNVDTYTVKPLSAGRLAGMINNEIMMDFISKRINAFFHHEREQENLIFISFNASTVYSRTYSYFGWVGMIIMAVVILLIPWLYLKILPADSPFFLTGFVILCTMFLFLAYDNTIRFTGLSFQLMYPALLHLVSKKFPEMRRIFVNNKVTS